MGAEGWRPGGIFTENVNKFLTEETEVPTTGGTLENILAKHNAAGWLPPGTKAMKGERASERYLLSDLFQIISKVAGKPSVWIGSFCRSGIPFGTDDLLKCNLAGYDPLSHDFFSGKMVRDGGALTTQTSLSANVMTQNFKGMLKKIILLDRDSKTEDENLRLLRVWSSTLEGEPLDYEDVCFILLLYNKIK